MDRVLTPSPMGIAYATAYLAAVGILLLRRGRLGVDRSAVLMMLNFLVIGAFAGSKLYYAAVHPTAYRLWDVQFVSTTGSSGSYGAIIGGALALGICARGLKLRLTRVTDAFVPAWLLAAAVGRVGCLVTGCCFGLQTSGLIGIEFSPDTPAGTQFPHAPILPTQMLESSIALIAFGAVILYERRRPRTGFVTALALLLYGVFRFSIDFFRYYPEDEVVGMVGSARLVISQLLAATLVGAAGVIFVRLRKISLRSEGTSQHGVAHSDD